MDKAPRSEQLAAQQRRRAVRLYQGGIPVTVIAGKLKRSVSWVYKWIAYRAQHLWTRFRSGSRAPHQHPNQTALVVERRVLRLREHLVQHRSPDARFAGGGAGAVQAASTQ